MPTKTMTLGRSTYMALDWNEASAAALVEQINKTLEPLDLRVFFDPATGQSPGIMLLDRPIQVTKVMTMQDPDSLIPGVQPSEPWPRREAIGPGSEENREPPLGGGEPVDNQHRKIAGYRDFDQATVDQINTAKMAEQEVALLLKHLKEQGADPRDIDDAASNLRVGFMLLIRAIAKPKDPWA